MTYRRQGPKLCIKWRDKRDVFFLLSTKHRFGVSTESVKTKDGKKIKLKPTPILDYNLNKAGVDRMDQLLT